MQHQPSIDDLFPTSPVKEAEVLAMLARVPPSSFLWSYVCHAGASTDCHAGYHVIAALALLTQSCPMSYVLRMGTTKYPNLYALIMGQSTESRKTAACDIAADILRRAIPGARGEDPGSSEGLRDRVQVQPRQLIFYEEFGAFLAASEAGYMQQMKTLYTSLYDCTPVGRATVKTKGQMTTVEAPRVSLLAASTFDFLQRHTESVDWMGGFLARFFLFHGVRERSFNPEPMLDEAVRAYVAGLLEQRANRMMHAPCAGMAPEALRTFRVWQGRMAACAASEFLPAAVRASVGRATGMVHRVALLLAWDIGDVHDTQPWLISGLAMELACQIVDWHIRSARIIGDMLSPTKDMLDKQTVYSHIGEDPTPLAKVLLRSGLLHYRFKACLDTLMQSGQVRHCGMGHGAGNVLLQRVSAAEQRLIHAAPPPGVISELPPLEPMPGMAQVIQLNPAQRSASPNPASVGLPDPSGSGGVTSLSESTFSGGSSPDLRISTMRASDLSSSASWSDSGATGNDSSPASQPSD